MMSQQSKKSLWPLLRMLSTNHNEQIIVRDLREAKQLSISLVAEDELAQNIVGHIAISPVKISDGNENWSG